ncbi:hypothetical protein E2C01_100188 [Portunus trituberculatus]|uniref:Uncharacterized protein n=1 Tax=Portunus trituberculatus TaxID=210409 RepID=A0A5B7KIS0_PORTR|nr:hypothetical protein [Portunus trituberculatus]
MSLMWRLRVSLPPCLPLIDRTYLPNVTWPTCHSHLVTRTHPPFLPPTPARPGYDWLHFSHWELFL